METKAATNPERIQIRQRNILFRYITLADATLKSITTYEFCEAHKDNNEAYLDRGSYNPDGKYPDCIPTLIGEMNRILGRTSKPKRNKPYLDHHANKHDNTPLWVTMNNLDLDKAFRFYDYLPKSIRFSIARRFQALYAETHFEDKRITHKDLKNAFDHIKDFRNRCPTTNVSTAPELQIRQHQIQGRYRRPRTRLNGRTIQLPNKGHHEYHYRNEIHNPHNRTQGHTCIDRLFIPGGACPFMIAYR